MIFTWILWDQGGWRCGCCGCSGGGSCRITVDGVSSKEIIVVVAVELLIARSSIVISILKERLRIRYTRATLGSHQLLVCNTSHLTCNVWFRKKVRLLCNQDILEGKLILSSLVFVQLLWRGMRSHLSVLTDHGGFNWYLINVLHITGTEIHSAYWSSKYSTKYRLTNR